MRKIWKKLEFYDAKAREYEAVKHGKWKKEKIVSYFNGKNLFRLLRGGGGGGGNLERGVRGVGRREIRGW